MDAWLLVLTIVIDLVSGFYPRLPPHWRTKTHADITNAGSLQAISEYIFFRQKMNGTSPSTALDDFYGTGMIIVFFVLTSKKKCLRNTHLVDIRFILRSPPLLG